MSGGGVSPGHRQVDCLALQGEDCEEADAALAPHLRHQLHRQVSKERGGGQLLLSFYLLGFAFYSQEVKGHPFCMLKSLRIQDL